MDTPLHELYLLNYATLAEALFGPLVAESSIDIASVPYTHDENQKNLSFDLVQNTIVTDAQAVKLILAFDLLYSLRIRILAQRINSPRNSSPYGTIERFKVPLRFRCKLDPVSQLDAQLFLEFLPGHCALFLRFRKRLARLFKVYLVL